MRFASIVYGSMHSRASDPYGSGQFAAPRDHYSRQHNGLDVAASSSFRVDARQCGQVTCRRTNR